MRLLLGIAVALALSTGAIHSYLGFTFFEAGLATSAALFGAMAAPYLIASVLVVLDIQRRLWIRLGIAYVALLLVVWAVAGDRTVLAYVDKAIEAVLLVVLIGLEVAPRASPRSAGSS